MWIRPGLLDLTYCSNIHPGESWPEVRSNVENYARSLKHRLSQKEPFGIGLRLSGVAAEQLLNDSELEEFKSFLDEHGLYVSLLNGYPFGSFNCGVVKAEVFSPDWREESRVQYTLNLLKILQHLLPAGVDGGISTLPLSYKPWVRNGSESKAWSPVTGNLMRVVEAMVCVRRDTGKIIHLDIEPEPDGLVECTTEVIRFFEGPLMRIGVPQLAGALGISEREATEYILDHVRVCFDTCHMSVEYEQPIDSLQRLTNSGIRIGRVQVSSALHARFDNVAETREQMLEQLQPFAESIYLHQVIERDADLGLHHYPDLGDALSSARRFTAREWRIHYHVPVFTGQYGSLTSNQQTNRDVLAAVTKSAITSHLEIETYTWDVLPAPLKIELLPSIEREYQWVINEVDANP